MMVFVVCAYQKVRILVLFVVLYDTPEESALRLSDVVRIACRIWTFCVVYKVVWCSSFVLSLMANLEPSFLALNRIWTLRLLFSGIIVLMRFFILLLMVVKDQFFVFRRIPVKPLQLADDITNDSSYLQCNNFNNVHSTFLTMPYGCMAKY